MEDTSPFLAMQQVESEIKALLRRLDADTITTDEKKAVNGLRRLAIDTRLDIRDYELSETREDQLKCATAAKKQLNRLQKAILATGANFSPADVAQLSAQLDVINGRLV